MKYRFKKSTISNPAYSEFYGKLGYHEFIVIDYHSSFGKVVKLQCISNPVIDVSNYWFDYDDLEPISTTNSDT